MLSGEFSFKIVRSRPAPPEQVSGQPDGTLSQQLLIYDGDRQFVAKVHRYLRPGQRVLHERPPDPKRVVVGDKMLALGTKAPGGE